jgi:hypothetical protein
MQIWNGSPSRELLDYGSARHDIIDEIWDLFHNISKIMSIHLLETIVFPESIASKYLVSNIES